MHGKSSHALSQPVAILTFTVFLVCVWYLFRPKTKDNKNNPKKLSPIAGFVLGPLLSALYWIAYVFVYAGDGASNQERIESLPVFIVIGFIVGCFAAIAAIVYNSSHQIPQG